MNRLLTTGALALTAAGLLASSAQAAGPNTCVYNPSSKNVSVKLNSGSFSRARPRRQQVRHLRRVRQDRLHQHDRLIATVNNTGAIFMNGSLSAPNEDFIVNYSGGEFLPGAKDHERRPEPRGSRRLRRPDRHRRRGRHAGSDFITVMGGSDTTTFGGVRVNGDLNNPAPSIKLPFGNPSLLRINGLGGSDFITGNGVFGTATTMHLRLTGGEGDDSLVSGLIAGDVLLGEAGDDSFDTKQGQRGDISNGGAGNDRATIDAPGDSAFEVETINGSIGVPTLEHTALKGRKSTVNLSWTHPQAWKQLAKVELGAFVGAERVGTVTMTPATGKITARGALSLTRRTRSSPTRARPSPRRCRSVARSVDTDNLHLAARRHRQGGQPPVRPRSRACTPTRS